LSTSNNENDDDDDAKAMSFLVYMSFLIYSMTEETQFLGFIVSS